MCLEYRRDFMKPRISSDMCRIVKEHMYFKVRDGAHAFMGFFGILQRIGSLWCHPGFGPSVTQQRFRMLAYVTGTIGVTPVLAPAPHNSVFGRLRMSLEPLVSIDTSGIS
jgi:hypothetical protein